MVEMTGARVTVGVWAHPAKVLPNRPKARRVMKRIFKNGTGR
jgi:hypothetical protein